MTIDITIDEVIKDLLYDAQCNRADLDIEWAERNEQLAEWLEELKAYRTLDKTNFSDGYNKAIDDYMNKLCNHCMNQTNECYKLECPFCTDGCDIVNIAEQLKAGGENERNTIQSKAD